MNDALTLWAERIVTAAQLEPGMTLLDVGAGGCALAGEIARLSGVGVIAVDRRAPASVPGGVTFLKGSALHLPVPAESVDAVLMSHLLHHLVNPEGAICQATAALRPGGRIIVRTASHADLLATPQARYLQRTLEPLLMGMPDLDVILQQLEAAGNSVLRKETVLTPREGTLDDLVAECVTAARREWAMFPAREPDPSGRVKSEVTEKYHEIPPVRETLIVARKPDLPGRA